MRHVANRALHATFRAVRRALDLVPITPLGLLVGVGAVVALRWVALRELDLVLLVATAGVLAMLAAAVLLVVLGAIRIALALRGHRGEGERTIETARSLPTGFALPGLLIVPLLQVRWQWEAPEAELEVTRKGLRLHEDATLTRRGVVENVRRRIVIEDALGLSRVALRHVDRARLKVLPHAGMLRDLPLLVSMAGGDEVPHPMGIEDGDRVELRRYAPGDPARFIHWKVFGRTRKLMVRMPERALSRSRRTVSYLVSGGGDEASAAAARVAIESGALGAEWSFGADATAGETSVVAEAIERVIRSAPGSEPGEREREGEDGGARALRGFVERAERTGPAALVIFAPPRPGPWLDRTIAVLRARGKRARVVIGVDGIDSAPPAPWWSRVALRDRRRSGTPIDELDAVLRALAALRVDVVIVDRASGRRIGDAQRAAARALRSTARARPTKPTAAPEKSAA
jgi:uncharacterized protein (DUF58 family)